MIFSFPAKKHRRTERPEKFDRYPKFKPALRREFKAKCIYCGMPDFLRGPDNFGVEHFKPKVPFTDLICEYTNLFYACNTCNRRKGNYWPNAEQSKKQEFYLNPCAHKMGDNFRFAGPKVVSDTETGKWVIKRLQLNDNLAVAQRSAHIKLEQAWESEIAVHEETLRECGRAIIKARGNAQKLPELLAIQRRAQDDLATARLELRRLNGQETL